MTVIIIVALFALFHLVMAFCCLKLGKDKGQKHCFWFGLLFGVFGLIYCCKLPDRCIENMILENVKEQLKFSLPKIQTQNFIGDGKPMYEKMNEEYLMKMKPDLLMGVARDSQYFEGAMKKFNAGTELKSDEINIIVLAHIFGNYNCSIDLSVAKKIVDLYYEKNINAKLSKEDENYPVWIHYNSTLNILYGLIYSYQKEYVKSVYHFIAGLKYNMISLSMPICDYIKYICQKLASIKCDDYEFTGVGSNPNNPAGLSGTKYLDPTFAPNYISNLVGSNGEIVVAKIGNSGLYGFLERTGAYRSKEYPTLVDGYFTYVIDKNYNLYKMIIFINNYSNVIYDYKQTDITVPDGFEIIKQLDDKNK